MNGDNPLGVAGIDFDFFAKGFDAAIDAAFGDGEAAAPDCGENAFAGKRDVSMMMEEEEENPLGR